MNIVHPFYQSHLKQHLKPAQYLLLMLVIQLLQVVKQVKLETLATHLPLPIRFESRRRKLQRFLSLPQFCVEQLWFPLVQVWLSAQFKPTQRIYLVIDRTGWMQVNLLVLSIVWGKRAYPLYWQLLGKQGSSSFAEQTQAISQVLGLLKPYQVVLLGDREFCSVRLAQWLKRQTLYFCPRLRQNEFIEVERALYLHLYDLCLAPGMKLYFQGTRVTLKKGFGRFNVACHYQAQQWGWAPEEPWFILTNLKGLAVAMEAYRRRFDIEEMFRDFKQGGYNLEATNVEGERLMALVLVIAIAYTSATLNGQRVQTLDVEPYVGRLTEDHRVEPRHSHFYLGSFAQAWVQWRAPYAQIVSQLLRLSPHKQPYYRKGFKAMNLIQSIV